MLFFFSDNPNKFNANMIWIFAVVFNCFNHYSQQQQRQKSVSVLYLYRERALGEFVHKAFCHSAIKIHPQFLEYSEQAKNIQVTCKRFRISRTRSQASILGLFACAHMANLHYHGRKGRHNSNFDLTSGGFLFTSCYLSKLDRQSKTIDFRQQSNHFLLFDSTIKPREA